MNTNNQHQLSVKGVFLGILAGLVLIQTPVFAMEGEPAESQEKLEERRMLDTYKKMQTLAQEQKKAEEAKTTSSILPGALTSFSAVPGVLIVMAAMHSDTLVEVSTVYGSCFLATAVGYFWYKNNQSFVAQYGQLPKEQTKSYLKGLALGIIPYVTFLGALFCLR